MVVPRHLLGANPTTSQELCTLLLDYLVGQFDQLAFPRRDLTLFCDPSAGEESDLAHAEQMLLKYYQAPQDSDERRKKRSATLLQLFERILKSLSSFADNETVVRRHLRIIVIVCFRSSMEEIDGWPDNYCMLLRYVFRSISAGKFEESYKELLPLIPTVLNGLYKIICSSRNVILRHTAVELCLTIPARLSSLLPHMNLLLRVIIPALDSNSGDLVNLG
jgi:transformation/transcription domain-associated protein